MRTDEQQARLKARLKEENGRKQPFSASSYPPAPMPGRQPLGRTEELKRRDRGYHPAAEAHEAYMNGYERRFRPEDRFREEPDPPQKPKKKRSILSRVLWGFVLLVCLAGLAGCALVAVPQLTGIRLAGLPVIAFANGSVLQLDQKQYDDYLAYRQYIDTDTIYPGVYIDNVHVGGMTRAEAAEAVRAVSSVGKQEFSVTVKIGDTSWVIDDGNVPITRNIDDMVRTAYAKGRANSTAIRGTGVTPFQERVNACMRLRNEPVILATAETYDHPTVRAMADSIAASVYRAPVNASVATFDFNTRNFTFNEDVSGQQVSADELYDAIIAKLDAGSQNAVLTVTPEILVADKTKAELMNSFRRISTATTHTTSNKNRNRNIELAASAISGITVMPGDTFSFNQTTGERTEAKGYKEAAAIQGGQSVPEIGGGVCQVSSTLFDAVAMANLEIVKRSPHAWPSSYVEKGLDATVNWPDLDFKWRNNTEWPIFIIAWYESRNITVEIYGMSLGDNVAIRLESVVTQTIEPPADKVFERNTSLPPGTSRTKIQARTGYVVETWQVWTRSGEEVGRNLLCTSRYKMYPETVEYN